MIVTMTFTAKVSITPQKVNECKSSEDMKATLAAGFVELSEFTNEQDIAKAVIKFKSSSATIYRHLRGLVGNLFFAIELYKFMYGEVDKRQAA